MSCCRRVWECFKKRWTYKYKLANVKLCEAVHTHSVVFSVGHMAHSCTSALQGVEFSFGPRTSASWTIWKVEAVSSGSPRSDLQTPPAWLKPFLSTFHTPASLSAPICAGRSLCVNSRHSFYPRECERIKWVTFKELITITLVIMLILSVSGSGVFISCMCCIVREDMITPLSRVSTVLNYTQYSPSTAP